MRYCSKKSCFPLKLKKVACQIQDGVHVSTHCGDKRMAWRCTGFSVPNYFVIALESEGKCINVSNVNKATVKINKFAQHSETTVCACHHFMCCRSITNYTLHTIQSLSVLCMKSRLLHELTASLLVTITTCSDTGSHNRLDLIQSLVPTHHVCNGYLSHVKMKWKMYKSSIIILI
jgi:hypothetical protein